MQTTKKQLKCLSAVVLTLMGIMFIGNNVLAEQVNITDFKDPAVREAVKEAYLSGHDNEDDETYVDYDVTVIETDDIKEMYIEDSHGIVKDLSGIEKLTKLETLSISKYAGNTLSFYQTGLKNVYINDSNATTVSVDAPYLTRFVLTCTGTVTVRMGMPKLTYLTLSGKKLTSLEGLDNMKDLEFVQINGTKLKKLDFTKFTKLTCLICQNNRLISLKLPKSLKSLYCYGNKLTKIDVSKCKNLMELYAGKNNLKSINVKKNKMLTNLSLSGNKNLKSLNVTQNKKLRVLYCSNTKISSLNLKNNKKLQQISYYGSKVKKLDLTGYKNLTILYAAKKGQTISFKNFLGTGYKCIQKPDNVSYNSKNNTLKVKKAFYFDGSTIELKKGKKNYYIRMIPKEADTIAYWELQFLP